MDYDIIIIGGGPAGMTAAIAASSNHKKVCILEHNDRVGQKILSTGNGKCNLTNQNISPSCYKSDSGTDFYSVIEAFMPAKVIDFFKSLGLLTKEKNGYIYPRSEQASSVLDTLRYALSKYGINVHTSVNIQNCKSTKDGFIIHTDKTTYSCQRLILAAGSKCAPKTGSDGSGYAIACNFGHSIIPVIPALVQLKCKESFYKELQGVRTEACLSLTDGNMITATEKGELQLTDCGISGIPVFQISRYVKRLIDSGKKPVIYIDFFPESSKEVLFETIRRFMEFNPEAEASKALCGIFNKKLSNVFLKECGIKPSTPCQNTDNADCEKLADKIKKFAVIPIDTLDFMHAQVCAGGVNLSEINFPSMESKIVPGLFFAGEITDVDGKCGGYNLQWAFSSGYAAGVHASVLP